MSKKSDIICAGCEKDSSDCGYDDAEDPVTEDGSYCNGKFVCDACYGILIGRGMDVGSPAQLQQSIVKIKSRKAERV